MNRDHSVQQDDSVYEFQTCTVEKLINKKKINGKTKYLVKYSEGQNLEDEWLCEEQLKFCYDHIKEYEWLN